MLLGSRGTERMGSHLGDMGKETQFRLSSLQIGNTTSFIFSQLLVTIDGGNPTPCIIIIFLTSLLEYNCFTMVC